MVSAAGTLIRWIRKNFWSVVILLVAYLGTNYVVKHFKKPGAMSVIEAQAMDMNAMKPPVGSMPVMTEVARSSDFVPKVTYTGTVVAYTDQDIFPRVVGRIVDMPLYPGDRVKAGQVVARLDTAELGAREETAAFGARAAQEEAGMAQAELKRAQRMRSEAKAKLAGARSGLLEAQHQLEAAHQEQEEAQADLLKARQGLEEVHADVRMAQADVDYWKAEIKREEALLKSGAVSQEEYDREKASAIAAEAKLRQTEAKVRQMEAEIRSAQARVRKAQANIASMTAKVAQMQAEVEAEQAGLQTAQAEIEMATRKVGSSQAMAEQARANWQATAVVKGYTDITTPVDGVVTARLISPGVLVSPGMAILKISEIGKVRLQANVAEKDLTGIRVGNPVWVHSFKNPKDILRARITSIFPMADPVARTAIVEAFVSNPNLRFIPGEYIVMDIATGRYPNAVTVPSKAIVYVTPQETGIFYTEKKPAVWVVSEAKSSGKIEYTCPMHPEVVSDKPGVCPKCNMKLEPRSKGGSKKARLVQVALGPGDGKRTVVLSGLRPGDEVIVAGHEYLKEGDSVTTGGLMPGGPVNPPTMESFMGGGHKGHEGESSGDKGNMGSMPGM